MKTRAFTLALTAFLLLAGTAFASTEGRWIHIQINDGSDEEVSINLPLSVISAAARMIPAQEVQDEMLIALDDAEMSWGELRDLWEEIKDAPEATYVTVRSRDEHLEVKKQGDYLVVQSPETGKSRTEIDVRFPLTVVDAFLSGPGGTLDFEAALSALADHGEGNLVSIRDGDETVRIWIDSYSDGR